MKRTDYFLLERVKKRDKLALEELYDSYAITLYSILHKEISDSKQIEIILTKVFSSVWDNADYYLEKNKLFFLLVQRCKNEVKGLHTDNGD